MEDVLREITESERRCAVSSRAHYCLAERYEHWNDVIGIPTIVIGVSVGSAILGTPQEGGTTELRIVLGLLSISAAGLSSLQTFFQFSEKAKQHTNAGAQYGSLSRQLKRLSLLYGDLGPRPEQQDDAYLDMLKDHRGKALDELSRIQEEQNKLAQSSPIIPDHVWEMADREWKISAGMDPREQRSRPGSRWRHFWCVARLVLALIIPTSMIVTALILEHGPPWRLLSGFFAPVPEAIAGPMDFPPQAPVESVSDNGPPSPAAATARWFETIRDRPPLLRAFLQQMPKGGDLHVHLSGAVPAEKLIEWATADDWCIDASYTLSECPSATPTETDTCEAGLAPAREGVRPVAELVGSEAGYNRLIDAWSMRNFVAGERTRHDRFFGAFGLFGPVSRDRKTEMLAAMAQAAAAENLRYVEVMLTAHGGRLCDLLADAPLWDGGVGADQFRVLEQALRDRGLQGYTERAAEGVRRMELDARELLGCSAPTPPDACGVVFRYVQQVNRNDPARAVFAQLAVAFALVAEPDGKIVGLNLVAPEDGRVALADYELHMRMLDHFHRDAPDVPVALHAGELTLGLVAPEHLRSHIRLAVRDGHAQRIGHGVSIGYEEDALELLQELAEKRIAIEINLSSNDAILGVTGEHHPFPDYRRAGVPVVISTDDPGISRSDLTHEYQRAVEAYALGYDDLKSLLRASLTYAFVEGASLWRDPTAREMVDTCASDTPGAEVISEECGLFLAENPKARLQWALEGDLAHFERTAWPQFWFGDSVEADGLPSGA